MSIRKVFCIIALTILLGACGGITAPVGNPASALVASVAGIQIRDAWVRAALLASRDDVMPTNATMDSMQPTDDAVGAGMDDMGGVNSAAYMTIRNTSATADRLIRVQSNVASTVELHTTIDSNGVMEMRPVEYIEIPANSEVQLKPGGSHAMLIDLTHDLKADDTVVIELQFARAGSVKVEAQVR